MEKTPSLALLSPPGCLTEAEGEVTQLDAAPPDLDGLYRSYAKYVAGVAFRLLGYDTLVDDIVQDVFLQAIKEVRRLRNPLAVRAWLRTVTIHMTRRHLRRRRVRAFFGHCAPEEIAAPVASPEQRDLIARVYRILDDLPANHRIAWFLRVIEGDPLEHVAASCGCSLATAKRRVAAAQAVIDKRLGGKGGGRV